MILPISIVIPYKLNQNKLILWMQKRETEPFKGLWEFPGGKIEPFESPVCAAIREVAEEVKVSIIPENLELLMIRKNELDSGKIVLLNTFLHQGIESFEHSGELFELSGMDDLQSLSERIPSPNIEIVESLILRFLS